MKSTRMVARVVLLPLLAGVLVVFGLESAGLNPGVSLMLATFAAGVLACR